MLERTSQMGAMVTVSIYSLYILLFIFRLVGRAQVGHWLAALQFLAVPPLIYLLLTATQQGRSKLYFIQISLMLLFLLVEFLLDYLFKIEFRLVRWMTISYVTLFFAATGGMLGVAAYAGRVWTISAVSLYLVMAILAFIQRAVTGL